MLRNYFKIAFRNLIRHKAFSFINVLGLSIGIACSILILLWVQDELSYDKFHANSENIYRVTARLPDMDIKAAVTPAPIAEAMQNEIPQIKSSVRIHNEGALLQVGDRMFDERNICFADSNFLQFFSFKLKEGDAPTALLDAQSILITEEMEKKYFGNESALGKVIRKNHQDDFTVTGVLENIPANSHLKFDFVQPMSFLARTNQDLKENKWDNFNFYTYVTLNENFNANKASLLDIDKKLLAMYKEHEKNLRAEFTLQPLVAIHLHSGFLADVAGHGNIQYVYIFVIVGIFVLAVACINFMNLATARSARRAKEVGLRKVAGAVRIQLILQFLAESSLIACFALVFALGIVLISLPAFNDLAAKNLSVSFLSARMVAGILLITLVAGLLAGSYPALFLSGFIPVKVLKGNLKAGASGGIFRNTLVIIQFVVSITLLVGTGVVYQQLQYIRNRNLGYDKENLVYAHMTGELYNKYTLLRSTLAENPLTRNFTVVSDVPTDITNGTIGVVWDGKDPDAQPLFTTLAIDENFINVFNMTLVSGRSFSKEFKADTSNLMVNESALKIMGLNAENAIGKNLSLWEKKGIIIGVVKDFNFKPVQQPIEPLILRLNTYGGVAIVKTQPGEIEETTAALEHVFKTLNPEYPFAYKFVDQDLENMYASEHRLSNLFTVFAGLAIFISCLGLYGLSAFLAERRTKEIGVRKVLGASVFSVTFLLSKTFTRPVLVAMLIATPLSWYVMNLWLEGFAFHVAMDWKIFGLSFLLSLGVAWLTVSFESIKAAMANPSKSLRDE